MGKLIHIMLKGRQEPLTFAVTDEEADTFPQSMREHLANYGFSGWRSTVGVTLNVGEVQAFWISLSGEAEPKADAAEVEQ